MKVMNIEIVKILKLIEKCIFVEKVQLLDTI